MALLPPSTNDRYHGSVVAACFLAVLGVLTIVPGCIHVFLPDGGSGVIAGIDLGPCGPIVIALFAWAGATQIALGGMMLLVGLRHRPLVPATLALVLLERSLHALNGWVLKKGSGHHPPEHYAVLILVPLLVVALAASLRTRASS
jgi:hypothetical protein